MTAGRELRAGRVGLGVGGFLAAAGGLCACIEPNSGQACSSDADCSGGGACAGDYGDIGTDRLYFAFPLAGAPIPVEISPHGYCCDGGPPGVPCPILGRPTWYRP